MNYFLSTPKNGKKYPKQKKNKKKTVSAASWWRDEIGYLEEFNLS